MRATNETRPDMLQAAIDAAVRIPDPAACNQEITRVHYELSQALSECIGPEVGANFHSWAVWGSRKAGVTIRQEDLESALRNATVVAAIGGFFIGIGCATGILFLNLTPPLSAAFVLLGGLLGFGAGAWTGRAIARYSRSKASQLILQGNRTVLEDIGGQTTRFVASFAANEPTPEQLDLGIADLQSGPTEAGRQELLKRAFRAYARASDRDLPLEERRQACYFGNCLAVYHEHIRLQPYISGSMPWIIRRCVTERMMQYEIGDLRLSVAEEFSRKEEAVDVPAAGEVRQFLEALGWKPSSQGSVSASDWTRLRQRMRYVVELFRRYHLDATVRSEPLSTPARIR